VNIKVKWVLASLTAVLAGAIVAVYAVLASYDFDDLRGVIEAQAKDATGRTLRIAGPMNLDVSLAPTLTIEKVTFGNSDWGTWPELLSVRRLEVEVELLPLLTGNILVRRLVAIEPIVLLETNAAGQGNWVIEGVGTASGEPSAIPAFRRIEIREGRAIYRNGVSGQEHLVTLQSLNARADTPASPSQVSIEGIYNGVSFNAEGTLGSRDNLLGGGRFPIDLEIVAGATSLKAEGAVDNLAAAQGLNLHAELSGTSLSDLGALIGEDLPALGPYTLAGRIGDTKDGIKLNDLTIALGESELSGDAAFAFTGDRPTITAELKAEALDLDDFIASRDSEAEIESGRLFSDRTLPVISLQTFDAFVILNAEQARFDDKTMMSELSLVLTLKTGRLEVLEFEAGFSGGILNGKMILDTTDADLSLDLNLQAKDFDYGHFLQGRNITDGIDGKLDADIELSAVGNSVRAWASSLRGRADITGGEGRVRSGLLSASGAGLVDVFSAWREGEADLQLNCVVLRLPIEGGVVQGETVLIDTAAVTVDVSGEVNLGDESLNLKVTPQTKHTSLLSLAVPLRVGGTILEPDVGPDALGTVLGAAKIAGMFINPLVAGAVIVLESEVANQNPCVAAIDAGGVMKAGATSDDDKGAATSAPRNTFND